MTRALIFGIAGQDGHYLSRHLVAAGYSVVGIDHRSRPLPLLPSEIEVRRGDLSDSRSLRELLDDVSPDQVYNLGAVSSLAEADADPALTFEVNGAGVIRLLEAIADVGGDGGIRFCQASSSQMFGIPRETPQDESTPLRPNNPYGVAKVIAHHAVGYYRSYHGAFATSAILFNHESPLRKERFVSRTITRAVARISLGLQDSLELDNLDGIRDWGFAGDYVAAMHAMLQHGRPEDFVVATGEPHSVRDLVTEAFRHVGVEEWEKFVRVKRTLPNAEKEPFPLGNSSKARRELGWMPKTAWPDLVGMMVEQDLASERGIS